MVLHPLTFYLKVSLGLKWVFCKQHIDGSCFLIHSLTLCLFIGALSPVTFRVSTERYKFIVIMMFVELEFLVVFSAPFQSLLLLVFIYLFIYLFIYFHFFLPQRVPLKISCRAGLVVTNSFNFCLSGKLFISPSIWMTTLLDKEFLAACFSDSAHWIYPATPFWPATFLWIGLLQIWSVFPFRLGTIFPLLLS